VLPITVHVLGDKSPKSRGSSMGEEHGFRPELSRCCCGVRNTNSTSSIKSYPRNCTAIVPAESCELPIMVTLEQCVRGRHSTRYFKEDLVPMNVVRECLSLAQLAPSNSNIQPWRMTIATGQARDRIVAALQVRLPFLFGNRLC
jgi:hypothetical protein